MTDGPSRPALLKEIERLKAELAAARASVERVVYQNVPVEVVREVERVVRVDVPVEVVREVEKVVRVDVPVEVVREVYVDNPTLLTTIQILQDRIAEMECGNGV